MHVMQLEASMIRSAQQKDPEAISWLYQTYSNRVYAYIAIRVRNKPDAEDLTAQVFVAMIEKVATYRGDGTFAAWLFRIAHNLVIDHMRSHKQKYERHTMYDQVQVEQIEATGQNPEEVVQQKLLQEEVYAAMQDLTELQRQVVALRFVAQLSSSEVATILGKKENAIYALQHAGLASLQRILRKQNVER